MPFYMAGSRDVPDHMRRKIDNATRSMIEHGLYQFYEGFSVLIMKLVAQKMESTELDNDEWRALTVDNLKAPLIFCTYIICFAWLVFVFEIIIYKIRKMKTQATTNNSTVHSDNLTVG